MCGIIGIASSKNLINENDLIRGRDSMIHRGPDSHGVWLSEDKKIGFGHRRLSIIDLTDAGHQPMTNLDQDISIVFNGEIYNYVDLRKELQALGYDFSSDSDTEVLLNSYIQWGVDCLDKLNGMFAFGLYDKRNNKIFIARDRAGEKPLFYSINNDSFHFSSELKGLIEIDKSIQKIDKKSLNLYLSVGYIAGDSCIYKNVFKLPAASALIFDLENGTKDIWRYWKIPNIDLAPKKKSLEFESDLLDELDSLLEASVKRQMVADVPVGVLLSGGVDSSLITAYAIRNFSNVKTFTVSFEGHKEYDESAHARLVSDYFKTDHTELNAATTGPEILNELAAQYDEPIIDSSIIPTFLVSKLVKKHCTVALGGDGGDELFGGYKHYSRLLWTQQTLGSIPISLRRPIAKISNYLPSGFKGRNWLQSLSTDFKNELPLIGAHFDRNLRNEIIGDNFDPSAEDYIKSRVPLNDDFLRRITQMDFENYMVEDILVKIDRASMLNSLELRAPFLDKDVIEFAFKKVPPYLKANTNNRKIILKKLTEKLLPDSFDKQRKQGFSIPLASWLKEGVWREYAEDILYKTNGTFEKKAVKKLFDGLDAGRNNSERIFGLMMFELWRSHYNSSL